MKPTSKEHRCPASICVQFRIDVGIYGKTVTDSLFASAPCHYVTGYSRMLLVCCASVLCLNGDFSRFLSIVAARL
jgi:hypothetical protein